MLKNQPRLITSEIAVQGAVGPEHYRQVTATLESVQGHLRNRPCFVVPRIVIRGLAGIGYATQ